MTLQDKKYNTNNFRSTLAQFFAAMGFSIINSNLGLMMAMPTIVIGALRTDDSPLGLSETHASWFGSLLYFVQPIGSLTSGFLQDRFGRKTCLMMVNVPQLVAWMIVYFASAREHLFICVALMGLSIGFLEAPLLSYIGETTQPRLRGVFSCFAGFFYNFGFMIETILGAVLPWRTMVLVSCLGPIIAFTVLALLPDSPAWLVTKGRYRDAERAYQWLRGWVPPEAVKEEMDAIVAYVRDTHGTMIFTNDDYTPVATKEGGKVQTPKSSWRVILEPDVLTSFRIVLSTFFISICASMYGMRPFFIEVLNDLKLPIKSENIVACCGVLLMMGSVGTILLIKLLGKRTLMFVSLWASILCCMGLGIYLMFGFAIPWVPVSLFCISYFSAGLGIIPIPWMLATELFPLRARSYGSSICAALNYVFSFIVTKTYYSLSALFGVSGVCFIYGIIGIIGFVYMYVDVVETEGVPLEVIERRLSERRISRKQSTIKNDIRPKQET